MKVSIVIISWNALNFLKKCLGSLYARNKSCDFNIILIDNNSDDGTEDFVKKYYPDILYYKNEVNRGVGPARNQGIKLAKGKYVLILDVDTEFITDDALIKLVNYMDENPDVGLTGAKLISNDGSVQKSCLRFPSVWVKLLVRFENYPVVRNLSIFKKYYLEDQDLSKATQVDYVIGAFQFIRKSAIEQIGMYDEKIFYGPEDIDFCLRLKKHGYKVIYFPDVALYHFYQRITRKIFSKITFKHLLGLFHFFWKHKYINYPKI